MKAMAKIRKRKKRHVGSGKSGVAVLSDRYAVDLSAIVASMRRQIDDNRQ